MSDRLPTLRVSSVRGASRVAAFVAGLPEAREFMRAESPEAVEREVENGIAEALQRHV